MRRSAPSEVSSSPTYDRPDGNVPACGGHFRGCARTGHKAARAMARCACGRDAPDQETGVPMFVSDRIVFLELQKTGCTHIRNLLKEIVGGRLVMRHNQAPADLFTGDRFFLGSVRDPWDWHVSLWAYCCDGRGDLYSNLS